MKVLYLLHLLCILEFCLQVLSPLLALAQLAL